MHIRTEELDPHKYIIIKGARQHNLQNIDVAIPRNKFVVITGLSGSGKSSLAFDTLYAEGQRRYVESLSSYARQFLGRMSKPDVDYIKGISPAIAIEQKVNTRNPRSTVGTSSEVYEYLKLFYARIGVTYSPISGEVVKRDTVTDVTDYVLALPSGSKVMVLAPLVAMPDRNLADHLTILLQQGFTRVLLEDSIVRIEDLLAEQSQSSTKMEVMVLIDRFVVDNNLADNQSRIGDSVQTAFYEGHGSCWVNHSYETTFERKEFSSRFEADGISFEEPTVNLFAFNNPFGACKTCEGFGSVIGIDEDLVIPDKSLSVYEDAVSCWKGEKLSEYKHAFIHSSRTINFPIHKPYCELSSDQKATLWHGTSGVEGIDAFFKMVEENVYKIQYRVLLSRYRGKTLCPDCKGTRLRKDAGYVKINGRSLIDLVAMPIDALLSFFENIHLSDFEYQVAKRLLIEISNRLKIMTDVGLGYLNLNRLSNTLSGGESQRLNLATSLGSSLVGSLYILDEPSIGLHPRDTHRLIDVLKKLRDIGNTVIVVEHDEEVIKAADYIIDIGPQAGMNGGKLVFAGTTKELLGHSDSLTALYLNHKLNIVVPAKRKKWKEYVEIVGAYENNLKNITVKLPIGVMTVVTGVSGSGKTTLIKRILFPALRKMAGGFAEKTGNYVKLTGDYRKFETIELVDQNPIGRSTRSNPATYVGAYDEIRNLFADQQLARVRGYKPGYFSFNIEGGRCEECEGDGRVKIEMQFMADIFLTCDSCHGKRFKDEVLDVKLHDKSISDVLDMTIDEAIAFFGTEAKPNDAGNRIKAKLLPLQDVGLGYLKVGQPSSTLSGGEAQRIKLAYFLAKGQAEKPGLFIFDEPTTGLHFHDIHKLLRAFDALIQKGHTLIVIEHNTDIVKCADWLIDLGPEGGDEGGYVVFEGTPEDMVNTQDSYTAQFLRKKILANV